MTTSAIMRREADRALRQFFMPMVKKLGFGGAGRHFRRVMADRIALVAVQYWKWGEAFAVNLAVCPPEGSPAIAPENVTAFDVFPGPRVRLTLDGGPGDCWFRYFNVDEFGPRELEGTPEECAQAAAQLLATHGEAFFKNAVRPWVRAGSA